MLTTSSKVRGFTLIELMVSIGVVSVLLAIAVPGMSVFIENARIRSTSESLQNGLSLARAESVRLNRNVEFIRRPFGWIVRAQGTAVALHTASGKEGNNNILLTAVPNGADRITFDPFGRRTANANGSAPMQVIDIESANPPSSTNYRPMRVQIQASGAPRLCRPDVGGTDSRACL